MNVCVQPSEGRRKQSDRALEAKNKIGSLIWRDSFAGLKSQPLLTERGQSEKAIHYVVPAMWHSEKGKTKETIKRSVVTRSLGEGGMNSRA